MIEIRPCKHCGHYPDIYVFYNGISLYVRCPKCMEARQFTGGTYNKSQYNKAINEIINAWNKEQEE